METLLTLLNKLKTLNKIKSFIKRKAKKYLNRVNFVKIQVEKFKIESITICFKKALDCFI